MKNTILLSVIIILLGIIICLVIFAIKNKNISTVIRKNKLNKNKKTKDQNKQSEIISLIKTATNQNLEKDEIKKLVQIFLSLNFPLKNGNKITKEAENYLNFILLISSHKNADAKIISHLSIESKKKNTSYSQEIEEYEEIGISSRKN